MQSKNANEISWDPESGILTQSGIRYVLMRPDVVMGAAEHLPNPGQYLAAISESAFENARDSFLRYRQSGALNGGDPIDHACGMAGKLGWGLWKVSENEPEGYTVSVYNSPFAIPANGGSEPRCGWITGVLRAVCFASHGKASQVHEASCAAQGHEHCTFKIRFED